MTEPRITIRRAIPADAEAILQVKKAAWADRYPNEQAGITAEGLRKEFEDDDGNIDPAAIKRWQTGIASEGSDRITYVAVDDGRVVGYASPHRIDGQRRVGALYVAPEAQGRGIGRELLQKVLAWHGRDEDIYLHVVSYNEAAIKFYEKAGFVKTGADFPGGHELPELEMVLKGIMPWLPS